MSDRCPSCGVFNSKGASSCVACRRDLSLPPTVDDAWLAAQTRQEAEAHTHRRAPAAPTTADDAWLAAQTRQEAEAHTQREAEAAAAGTAPTPAEHFPGGRAAQFVLTVGQVAAVFGCILAIVGIFLGLSALSQLRRPGAAETDDAGFFVVVSGIVSALLSAAMFVVFTWVKALPKVAEQQDAENRRVRETIDALRAVSALVEVSTPPDQTPEQSGGPLPLP